jgi:hypothetical protein
MRMVHDLTFIKLHPTSMEHGIGLLDYIMLIGKEAKGLNS